MDGLPRIIEFPHKEAFRDVCRQPGATGTNIILKDGEILPARLLVIEACPVAIKNSARFSPGGQSFLLTAEESLSSTLCHEAIHAFFRMGGYPQIRGLEERFVQEVERELLFLFFSASLRKSHSCPLLNLCLSCCIKPKVKLLKTKTRPFPTTSNLGGLNSFYFSWVLGG